MNGIPTFWAGRRVLVTGHTGFVGAWAGLWLQHLGAAVTGLSLPPATVPNLHEALWPRTGMEDIIADLRDPAATAAALRLARPQTILHLAGCWDAAAPIPTLFGCNAMGTVNLLAAAAADVPDTLVFIGDTDHSTALGASMAAREAAAAAWRPQWGEAGRALALMPAGPVAGGGWTATPGAERHVLDLLGPALGYAKPPLTEESAALWTETWHMDVDAGADPRLRSLADVERWEDH